MRVPWVAPGVVADLPDWSLSPAAGGGAHCGNRLRPRPRFASLFASPDTCTLQGQGHAGSGAPFTSLSVHIPSQDPLIRSWLFPHALVFLNALFSATSFSYSSLLPIPFRTSSALRLVPPSHRYSILLSYTFLYLNLRTRSIFSLSIVLCSSFTVWSYFITLTRPSSS